MPKSNDGIDDSSLNDNQLSQRGVAVNLADSQNTGKNALSKALGHDALGSRPVFEEYIDYFFGQILKDIREQYLQLNQSRFATLIGIQQPQLSLIEEGKYNIKFSQFFQFCDRLKIDPLAMLAKLIDNYKLSPDMKSLPMENYSKAAKLGWEKIGEDRYSMIKKLMLQLDNNYTP